MHSSNKHFRPSHESTFPITAPRQENLGYQARPRRIVKQDNVPERSPFLRLSNNNRTLQLQAGLGSHTALYPEPFPHTASITGQPKGIQANSTVTRLDQTSRHSSHHGVKQPALHLPRHSLQFSQMQARNYSKNDIETYTTAAADEELLSGADIHSQPGLKKEPDSSALRLDIDNYECLLDTEPPARDNDATFSEQGCESSASSVNHRRTTFAEEQELRQSQSKLSHANVSDAAEPADYISHWMEKIPAEYQRAKAALKEKVGR